MPENIDFATLEPLLTFADQEADVGTQIAALDAASRLPLDEDAWREYANALHYAITKESPGSELRREALRLAVRVPLMSMRDRLRDMAEDPNEPDRDGLVPALEEVGDAFCIWPLIDRAKARDGDSYQLLAAMPLETEFISPNAIPAPPDGASADVLFWHALVKARLGDFAALDEFLERGTTGPTFLDGDPWTAYNAIAAIRPIPDAMRAHLADALSRLENLDDPRQAKLTVWAATGIADAEGEPISPAEPEPPSPPTQPSPSQITETISLSEELPEKLFAKEGVSQEELDVLKVLPTERVAGLVTDIVVEANRRAHQPPDSAQEQPPGEIVLGNSVIEVIGSLPPSKDWPVADLATWQIATPQPALDDDQLGWVIARGKPERVVADFTELLNVERPAGERVDLLNLLGTTADHLAGRGGSPFRGAGSGGGGEPLGSGPLIDDRPHEAMIGPSDQQEQMMEPPDERKVHAQIRQDGKRRNTFVAGADNVICCWIGLEEIERGATADESVPDVAIPPEGLPLSVELCWGDQSDRRDLILPADRTAPSRDCDLHLHVPQDESSVSALIMFRYRGRAFEVVQVSADALAPDEPEEGRKTLQVRVQAGMREVIELPDRTEYDSAIVCGLGDGKPGNPNGGSPVTAWVFGGTGANRCELEGTDKALTWLNEHLFTTEKRLVRKRKKTEDAGTEDVLNSKDPEVLELLRDMARIGSAFHKQLRVSPSSVDDVGERIQLLNLEPSGYVPLEFIYDRGYPADDAKLCEGWEEALQSDDATCPVCSNRELTKRERGWTPTICPLGFWSLQKIIERRDPERTIDGESTAHPSVPTPEHQQLRVIDDAVFASSHRVPENERAALRSAMQHDFTCPTEANDWDEWLDALEERHPPLLLALPHHDAEGALDYLEIGDKELPTRRGKLSRGQLDEIYVNPTGIEPGPIVMLLGCQTGAKTEEGYVQMARRFQQLRASIVLGTLGKILGRHAAPVACEVVSQLVTETDPDADFAIVMRRVRRRMLAKGYLMALCLVALGDAEWHLNPRPRPTADNPEN